MKRFWNSSAADADRLALPAGAPGSSHSSEQRYETRPTRPQAQLAVRVALWGAVALGAAGGLASVLGFTGGSTETVLAAAGESGDELPAPVASVAERAVEAWLTSADEDLLRALFVEPPEPRSRSVDEHEFEIGRMTPVSGGEWEEGYWLVTLAVDVHECVEPESEEDDPELTEGTEAPIVCDATSENEDDSTGEQDGNENEVELVARTTTWFVEVGVVGELDRHVAALATPALVAPPAEVSDAWQSAGGGMEPPGSGEPIAETVESFLREWLADGGDPSRYLAPGIEAERFDQTPFTELTLVGVAYDELESGHVRTRAELRVTTPGGVQLPVAYEVEVRFRDDRWEVSAYWGAPTLAGRPVADDAADPGEGDSP